MNHPAARISAWRRLLLIGSLLLLGGCTSIVPRGARSPAAAAAAAAGPPPILFVHGNGDSAALWQTTLWRFESNGWPRDRLFAIDMPYPLARDEDAVAQPGRSSTDDQVRLLATEVDRVLQRTGARQLVLVANSRGGYAVRNLIASGGRAWAAKVSHAVLGGTPNHGVRFDPANRPGNEFNGAGPFLQRLNRPRDSTGSEVDAGVHWLTIRSDNNDKFAQPTGEWIGAKGQPTGVGHDGPALKGATNVVLRGADHRESSFSAAAFAETWRFLTGEPPSQPGIVPEAVVQLDGRVFGSGLDNRPGSGNYPNNLPLAGAQVEVFAVDSATGARRGRALLTRTIDGEGRWGPLVTDSRTPLEFVVSAPGFATTHIYRTAFPRSSSLVHLRPEHVVNTDRNVNAVVVLSRPRGYFGIPRDEISLDGRDPPPGIDAGVAGVSTSRLVLLDAGPREVVGRFHRERIVGRLWPAVDNHITILEVQD